MYIKNGDGIENPSVSMPIDECSFIYYLRTLRSKWGKRTRLIGTITPTRIPLSSRCSGRGTSVPAGEYDAIVLKPVIKSNGLFSEKGDAEVWLASDASHTLLRLKSKLPLGTLYLELKEIERPTSP